MKKKISILAIAVASILTVSACSSPPPAAPAAPVAPAANATTDEPAPQFSPGEFTLRIATVVSGDHAWVQMAEFMQEELSARSDGAIEVMIFPGGQLGNDEATIDDMRLGTLDIVIGGTQNAAPFVPQFQVLQLPYFFSDRDQFESVLLGDGPVFAYIQNKYEEYGLGLQLLGLSNGGQRNMKSNMEIRSVEDIQGISMRTTASATEGLIWSTLGTLPISMGFNDIYTAMQANMIDAFEVTLAAYTNAALYEVAPSIILTGHQFTPAHVTASNISFNRLPAEFQRLLREVSEEASRLGTQIANNADDTLVNTLESDHGANILEVDASGFRALMEPLYPELTEAVGGEALFQIIRDIIG